MASADKPDSRLVMSDVQVLEKQTALDSAHVAMPLSFSMPRSYGVHDKVASMPRRSYA